MSRVAAFRREDKIPLVKTKSCFPQRCTGSSYQSVAQSNVEMEDLSPKNMKDDAIQVDIMKSSTYLNARVIGVTVGHAVAPIGLKEHVVRFFDGLHALFSDQDFKQRFSLTFSAPGEFIKMIACSMLLITIPQQCGDGKICTTKESFFRALDFDDEGNVAFFQIVLVFNVLTLVCLLALYFTELWRENVCIEFLEVNPNNPSDAASVGKALLLLSPRNRERLFTIDGRYKTLCFWSFWVYLTNVVLSGIAVQRFYIGDQTFTSWWAFSMLMKGRLDFAYSIASQPKEIFYSAYLKEKVQFNDCDNDHNTTIVGHESEIGILKNARKVAAALKI